MNEEIRRDAEKRLGVCQETMDALFYGVLTAKQFGELAARVVPERDRAMFLLKMSDGIKPNREHKEIARQLFDRI